MTFFTAKRDIRSAAPLEIVSLETGFKNIDVLYFMWVNYTDSGNKKCFSIKYPRTPLITYFVT